MKEKWGKNQPAGRHELTFVVPFLVSQQLHFFSYHFKTPWYGLEGEIILEPKHQ